MSASPPDDPGTARALIADDNRRMAPIYTAVIIVEVLTLLALWWFQQSFS